MTLEIYTTVNEVERNNLSCVSDGMKCEGTLLIPYEGGKERNKWIKEELKDQALKLFKSATFNDGKPENNFKVEWDFENVDDADKKRYLGDIATDPQKLCGCVNVPKCEPIEENLRWIIKNNNIHKYLVPDPDPKSENKRLPLLFKGNFM